LQGLPPDDCEASYGNIVETTRLAAPYFDDFVLEPYTEGNDEKVKLQWRQKDMLATFQPHHLSDGTLRFICLATALLQPRPPQLLIIDEPELGLHPEALAVLAELIRSCRARTQFILATQSPTFADCFLPEDIVTVQRRDGRSIFERQSAKRLAPWLESYSLGQLWQKNVIRGGICHD
jgi:predicted ATPase